MADQPAALKQALADAMKDSVNMTARLEALRDPWCVQQCQFVQENIIN